MRKYKRLVAGLALVLLCSLGSSGVALANSVPQSSSPNYQVNEVFFGSGGTLNSCSTTYCSKQAAGETAVGNTKSTDYQAQAGFNTDRQPYLEFTVSNTNLNLGELTSTTTKTANATFSVKSYLARGGYVVTQTSPGPTNGNHVMQGLATPTASAVGQEQFGINLVANTTAAGAPADFGAGPVQSPDSTFSFGQVKPGYDQNGKFKYVQNDIIAYSDTSSGTTNFTISYIFNVSNLTSGGQYVLHHVLVATSTF